MASSWAVVEGLVEPEPAFSAKARESGQVLRGEGRRHQAGQYGGGRGNDQIRGQTALQSETPHSEGAVLIIPGAIGQRVRGLRDSPRQVAAPAVLSLAP